MDEPQRPKPLRGLPRRREIAALYLLARRGPLNLGDAIDLIREELCTTKKTARNIIKRLRRIGLLYYTMNGDGITVNPLPLEMLVEAIAIPYIEGRKSRLCRHNRG